MGIAQRISSFLGVGGDRSAQPPTYKAVADGLIITETHAEAWYVLSSSNTDLMTEVARDAELDQANSAFARTLAGYDCHLRVLWSPLHAEDYRAEAGELFNTGNWRDWAELRVQRLAQIGLPSRHLLLGVRLNDRTGQAQAIGRKGVQDGLGLASTSIKRRELACLDATMRRLGRRLESSPWKAAPASVEMLGWMLMREQHRTTPVPTAHAGVISGASLAALSRGRILPYPDHLRVMDAQGQVSAYVSVLTMTSFPETMESPGNGEWLRVLSEITYVPEIDDDEFDEVEDPARLILPVSPEASVRFKVLPKRDALKRVDDARRLAKEQRRSAAKHSAEDPGRDIEETEDVMAELARDMQREDLTLVEDHPRLIVTSTESLDDLRARVDAVVTYYGGVGIEVHVAEEEQREAWLEAQPGDQLRIPDLGHIRDVSALSGSWFWGGAHVGDSRGPIVGYLTGSTPGVFRSDVTAGSERGDATTTAFVGRSGRGKTTAMMMSMLDAAFRGAFLFALDFKGDLGGVVTAGRAFGLNAHLVTTSKRFAGAADLFTLLGADGTDQAQTHVPAQLSIACPPHLRLRGAETPIQSAVNAVIAQGGQPATWRVIEHLLHMDDELARETGSALYDLAQTDLAAPFMGKPTGDEAPIRTEPGIWVVQVPGIDLPEAATAREDWTTTNRLSVALMYSMLAYGVTTAGRRDLRGMRKAVCVPEVHVLTSTSSGVTFLNYIARVGRALSTALLVDTQDPEGIVRHVGIVEQLSMVVGFQLTTIDQQDALARLLGLEPGPHSRALIQEIGMQPDGEIRHGHSIIRDHRFRCATAQWDISSWDLRQQLDTTPKAADQGDGGDVHMEKAGV